MAELDRTSWEILNATADDCENLEHIYQQIHPFLAEPERGSESPLLTQIADHIRDSVSHGLLSIIMDENGNPWLNQDDLSYVWRGWFRMTPIGKDAWESAADLFVNQHA